MIDATDLGYRIDLPAEEERLELHVLARAYRDAWLVMKARPPVGRHRISSLGLTIEFDEPRQPH
jgi:hypothetical protein